MPPTKSAKTSHDDGKAESASAKDRNGHGSVNHSSNGKFRRVTSSTGSGSKDTVPSAHSPASGSAPVPQENPSLQWSTFDRDILHAYRREHRLTTPTSFAATYHQLVLSQPGSIGLHSPTMARRIEHRRQSKEQLAMAVRKHFNGMGIQETDAIVDFIHKVRSQNGSSSGRRRHGVNNVAGER